MEYGRLVETIMIVANLDLGQRTFMVVVVGSGSLIAIDPKGEYSKDRTMVAIGAAG